MWEVWAIRLRRYLITAVDSIMTTINGAMDIEEALKRAEELYISAADRTFRMLKAGMSLGRK